METQGGDDAILLGDAFAPVTSELAFVQARLEHVVHALFEWRARLYGSADRMPLEGRLVDNLQSLEPLTIGVAPRELVMETRNPEWVAYFDCGVPVDHRTPTMHLSSVLGVRGVVVNAIPDVQAGESRPERFGARQLIMFGPDGNHFLNYERSISVMRDGSRWQFDAAGPEQSFERIEAYKARRVADRFTSEMLVEYCAALGLAPFEADFYSGRATLVSNPLISPRPTLSYAQAQAREGIVPRGVGQ